MPPPTRSRPAAWTAALLLLAAGAAGAVSPAAPVAATLAGLAGAPPRGHADRCAPEHRALMTACRAVLADAWGKYDDAVFFAGTRATMLLREQLDKRVGDGHAGLEVMAAGANAELLDGHMRAGVSTRLTCYRALGNAEVDGALRLHPDCFHVDGRSGRSCLFFHGPGFEGPAPKKLRAAGGDAADGRFLASFPLDFGDTDDVLRNQALCDPIFYSTETLQRGWDDEGMQHELCRAVQAVQPDLVFSSSASSLALAAGAARGLAGCDRLGQGEAPVEWFTVGSPFDGAPMRFVEGACTSCVAELARSKDIEYLKKFGVAAAAACKVVQPFYRGSFCEKKSFFSGKYTLYPAYESLVAGGPAPGGDEQGQEQGQEQEQEQGQEQQCVCPTRAELEEALDAGKECDAAFGDKAPAGACRDKCRGEEAWTAAAGPKSRRKCDGSTAPAAAGTVTRRAVCNCPTKSNYVKALNEGKTCESLVLVSTCVGTCQTKFAYRQAKGAAKGSAPAPTCASRAGAGTAAGETAVALLEETPAAAAASRPRLVCGADAGEGCVTLRDVATPRVSGQMCAFNTMREESPEEWWNAPATWAAEKAFAVSSALHGRDGWPAGDSAQVPPRHGNDGIVAAGSCMLSPRDFRTAPRSSHYAIQTHAWGARCTALMRTTQDPRRDPCGWYTFVARRTRGNLALKLDKACKEQAEVSFSDDVEDAGDGAADAARKREEEARAARELACPAEVRRLWELIKDGVKDAGGDGDDDDDPKTPGAEDGTPAVGAEHHVPAELAEAVDDFVAALDDNRDRRVSAAEFRWWEVMQGGQLETPAVPAGADGAPPARPAAPLVYATLDADADGTLTTAELRAGLPALVPDAAAVHALTDRVRAWHQDVVRVTVRAGAAPKPSRVTRLVRERRWVELVEDLYLGAFKRGTDTERLKQHYGLTDWDVDFLEASDRSGVLQRLSAQVRLYQDTRSKNREPQAILREFFNGVDLSGDDALSRDEVASFLKNCGGFCRGHGLPEAADAGKLMASDKWDANEDGAVSFSEFAAHFEADVNAAWEMSAGVRDAGRAIRAARQYARDMAAESRFLALDWMAERKWEALHAEYRRLFHGGPGSAELREMQRQEQELAEQQKALEQQKAQQEGGGVKTTTATTAKPTLSQKQRHDELQLMERNRHGLPETMVALVEEDGDVEAATEPLDLRSVSLITSFVVPLHYIRDLTQPPPAAADSEVGQLLAETRREAVEERNTAALEAEKRAELGKKNGGHLAVVSNLADNTAEERAADANEQREVEAVVHAAADRKQTAGGGALSPTVGETEKAVA